jgi:polyphosphate kinase
MVELKARFDEENNLRWVKRLEEEGIHVAYGTIGLKTHTKTALVVREEDDGVQLYSHVATGNYHSETAKTYVDLGMLTADKDVGQDLVRLFNFFTGHSLHTDYRKTLVAPTNMRPGITGLIRREARNARQGKPARIVAKMNSLEDPEIVRELYEASMAGVEIDLIVRGICRLRPGLAGISDTVRVHSVVGRFLEHSRIFYFENDGDPDYYIGSADWMTRNLDRRVEAVAPVEDPDLREELWTVFEIMLEDNRKRWVMDHDGTYEQVHPDEGEPVRNTHRRLMHRAREAAPDEEPTPIPARRTARREPSVDLEEVFTEGNEP